MAVNPYTRMFGKEPKQMVPRNLETSEIIDNFSDDEYNEQLFFITGLRGSGKTVLMADVANTLRKNSDWTVIELNSESNLLESLASKLANEKRLIDIFKQAKINLSFFGIELALGGSSPITNVEVAITRMLETMKKHKKRLLVTIDEVVCNQSMKEFAGTYQIFIGKDLPIFLLMTGLFENVSELQNQKNLTFLLRAPKIVLKPLNLTRIADNYEKTLNTPRKDAEEMARLTKGYSYAFQILGYYCWQNKTSYTNVISQVQEYLEDTVYDKIWSELSNKDKEIVRAIAKSSTGKVSEIRDILNITNDQFNPYKKRLEKKGLLIKEYGFANFSLPLFKEYVLAKID